MHGHGDRAIPARPPRLGWRRPQLAALVGALALTLAVAACGGGVRDGGVASLNGSDKPTASTNASGSKDFEQAALEFARCMRQHGIDLPDPRFTGDGGVIQEGPSKAGGKGPDAPEFKAAQQACQKYMPNGGHGPEPNAQQLRQMVQFARCMRQHGIDIPDPSPSSGGIVVHSGSGATSQKGPNPDDPEFKAAQQACQHYLPNAGKERGTSLSSQGDGGGR